MINLTTIKELYIASGPIDFLDESKMEKLDYHKWVTYIENSCRFTWYEETEIGKNALGKINTVPDEFKDSILALFNKTRCYTDYDNRKKKYNIVLSFNEDLKRIIISFERKVNINDLRFFFSLAGDLDAFLLNNNGKDIIDETAIESLE